MPRQMIAGRGSLWVVTCDRRCSGEARRSAGRIVRIDPRSGRVVASAAFERPGAIAVGAGGIYAIDFWRDTLRRFDPRTLQVVSALRLTLPFRFTAHDNHFVPSAVGVGPTAVWIATERCVLARADLRASHVVATVRLPCDAFGALAVGAKAVWIGESLAGLYRIDPETNRVVARIRIRAAGDRLDAERVVIGGGRVFVAGEWASGTLPTGRTGLARVDPRRNRIEAVTPLPAPPVTVAFGKGALWVARVGGSSVEQVDPGTSRVVRRLRARVGISLTFAGGQLWTFDRDGTIRRLAVTGSAF